MRAPSLFIVGLLIGAAAIFLVRAVSQSEAAPDPTTPAPVDRSAHGTPSPADPPSPAPVPEDHGAHAMPEPAAPSPTDDGRTPENLICPVMDEEVDPDIYVDHEGRRIGFCCDPCVKKFLEDPETYLEKVDEELRTRGVIR